MFDPFKDFASAGYLRNRFQEKDPEVIRIKKGGARIICRAPAAEIFFGSHSARFSLSQASAVCASGVSSCLKLSIFTGAPSGNSAMMRRRPPIASMCERKVEMYMSVQF